MKNFFNSVKTFFGNVNKRVEARRETRKTIEGLERIAIVHETLNKFRSAGLLYVDFKHNNVTISQILAEQFIYDDLEWQNFLSQVHQWAVFQYSVNEYTKLFRETQADAEAKAYKKDPNIDESGRKLARMKALSQFDSEHGGKHMAAPDIQFYVLGLSDGEPLIVSKLVNGKYESATIE